MTTRLVVYAPAVGYKHDEARLVAAAVDLALESGFSSLTYGRLARKIGVSDRLLVYYFPTKVDLIEKTVAAVGAELQAVLGEAFTGATLPPGELVERAWPVLTTPAADRVFAAFFELVGLSAAGRHPYRAVVPSAIEAWVSWLMPQVDAPDRRSGALSVIATLDGLLLIRHSAGPQAGELAYAALCGD